MYKGRSIYTPCIYKGDQDRTKSLGGKVTDIQDTGDTRQRRSSKNDFSKQATDDSPVKKFTFEKVKDENPRVSLWEALLLCPMSSPQTKAQPSRAPNWSSSFLRHSGYFLLFSVFWINRNLLTSDKQPCFNTTTIITPLKRASEHGSGIGIGSYKTPCLWYETTYD